MKRHLRKTMALILAIAVVLSFSASVSAVTSVPNSAFQIRTGSASGSIAGLKYYVYSPVKGPTDTTRYPVMFWLHGLWAGGSADYAALDASDVKNFASPEYQAFFPEGGCYIVVPQNPEGDAYPMGWMTTDSTGKSAFLGVVNNVIDYVLANDQVNRDRVYVGGYSAGGLMTWQTVISRPSLYAAAFPICPAYKPTNAELATLTNMGVWIIHGTQDPVCDFNTYTNGVYETLVSLGCKSPRLTALSTVLNPDKTTAPTQHHAWVAVTANLMYNDGTRYDPNYSGTFLSWLSVQMRTLTIEAETAVMTGIPSLGVTFIDSNAAASGGKLLGYLSRVGNTATWTVKIPVAGTYKMVLRLAGTGVTPISLPTQMRMAVDNVNMTLSGTVPAVVNNNYYNFASYGPFNVTLSAGTHTFRMTTLGTVVPNFDYFSLTRN